ncbi:MAG: hypothetical protein GY769_10030 [bacterium]|nr:hypothetical protein [bacterium]
MRAEPKPRLDDPPSDRDRATPAARERRATAKTSRMLASDPSKCPELRDLLGDYSEQTGSLFG